MSEEVKSGWGWIKNSPKFHYFHGKTGVSICGKWLRLGSLNDLEDFNDNSADNCGHCKRKVKAMRDAK